MRIISSMYYKFNSFNTLIICRRVNFVYLIHFLLNFRKNLQIIIRKRESDNLFRAVEYISYNFRRLYQSLLLLMYCHQKY